jgi:hypothetical protein
VASCQIKEVMDSGVFSKVTLGDPEASVEEDNYY